MEAFRQFLTVTRLSARSFPTRVKASLVIVAGLVCVAGVMLIILSMAEGLKRAYLGAGDPQRVVILSAGAAKESESAISNSMLEAIERAPGIRKLADGMPLVDAEFTTGLKLAKQGKPEMGNARVRGFGSQGFRLRPELKLLAGRLPRRGSHELLAGVMARRKFAGLELGGTVALADGVWRTVGVFSTGSTLDGDLIADGSVLRSASGRDSYNSVLLRLESPGSLTTLQRALHSLPLTVERQSDYYNRLWQSVSDFPIFVAYALGFLIAMGALSGTVHTMHAAVSCRAREIAILRALGFAGGAVAASVVAEAMLLAFLGAGLGTLIDWLWLDGTAYNGGVEGGVFRVTVTLHLLVIALGWALAIALLGAALPARKAARATVVQALREL